MRKHFVLVVLGLFVAITISAAPPASQGPSLQDRSLRHGRRYVPEEAPTLWQLQEPLRAPIARPSDDDPVVDVGAEANQHSVVAGDVDPTIDVQITQEIIDKATELGTPEAMYEFVRNECEFQPYYGSRKGSVETLRQRAGNDYDLASLLIALLRSQGVPARYGEGQVEMPVDRVTSWLAVEDGTVAGSILFTNGMEGVSIVSGPDVVAVRAQRVWVEAFLPQGLGSPQWLPLDPAFALNDVHAGIDIPAEMGLDAQAYVQEYYDPTAMGVTLPRPETVLELLQQDVTDYVTANHPGLTLDDVLRTSTPVAEHLGLLPTSLPYTVRSYDGPFSEIPSNRRYQIRFHLYNGGTTLIDHTVDLPTIASERVTITYVGATSGDQAIIDSNNGLLYTSPNLIDVTPVLKVGGQVEAQGATGIGAGRTHSSDIHFLAPSNSGGLPQNVVPAIFNSITAGEAQAVGFAIHGVTNRFLAPDDPSDTEGFLFELPNATAMEYLERGLVGDDELGELLHARVTHDVDDAIVKEQIVVTTDGGGNPIDWEWRGLTVDADRKIIGAWKVDEFETGCDTEGTDILIIGGAQGSLDESRIYEDNFGREAVSTIQILQLAVDQGVTVYHRWNSTTLPTNTQPTSVRNAIISAIAGGHEVTFPADPITYFNWTGTGWIDMDPCSGAAGYIISGGQNGGSTVDTWTNTIWWTNPFKTVECVEGAVDVPAMDAPDPGARFCSNDPNPLHFEYRARVRYDDGTHGSWWSYTHNSKKPSELAPGNYFLTVGDKGESGNDQHKRKLTIIKPTGETSTFLGWSGGASIDISQWSATLTPASIDFSGIMVTENPIGSGTGTTDTCWFAGSALPMYSDCNSISGGTWTVGANNKWMTDNIGITTNIDAYYAAQGRTPCAWHTVQHMKVVCPDGNVEYTTNNFDWAVRATGTTISRGGTASTAH